MTTFNTLNSYTVPEIFNPLVITYSQEKSRLIRSRAVTVDPQLNTFLAGAGLTCNIPSFRDLQSGTLNSATATSSTSTADVLTGLNETQLRLSYAGNWKSFQLEAALLGKDPTDALAQLVGNWWAKQHQKKFIATMKGVFADNDAAPTGTEHVRYDLVRNLAFTTDGANTPIAYNATTTRFSPTAFAEACMTMGDSMDTIGTIMVHSHVYTKMWTDNQIITVPASETSPEIKTYMGREVIIDDSMPNPSAGVYESWLFGDGAVRLGFGVPSKPTAVIDRPEQGNGFGAVELFNRVEWVIAPVGTSWVGAQTPGGVIDDTALSAATAWQRVYPERKQIPFARLVTREA